MKHRPLVNAFVLLLSGILLMAADKSTSARTKTPKVEKPTTEGGTATPAELLTMLPGFKVELLRSAQVGEDSWIAMTVDRKGRLIISPQGERPMLRMTLDAGGHVAKVEPIAVAVTGAMGLLVDGDTLYVNGAGPDGYHLYRVTDSDGDDQFDKVELIHKWVNGKGEHGPHAILKGRDDRLYIVCGNGTDVPADILGASPHRNYAEDHVLPRADDANGFGAGRTPPAGFVLRMDRDGGNVELFCAGLRNTYDVDFNADGELFGFDSDKEGDFGMPWYRPIRVCHLVSGGEYGFREGSGKWPEYYEDSLPPAVNVGIGSPTGVCFGTGAKFPARYQRACFAMDWTYGRLLAVHLAPRGASYTATSENFVAGQPLNLTDALIGPDGTLYFITGGRRTQSGLYRVSYAGAESTAPVDMHDVAGTKDRVLRHQLEGFDGEADVKAVDIAWPHLDSADRWIRFAARIAIEAQPVAQWQARALAEIRPHAALTALLALARLGGREAQDGLFAELQKFPVATLSEEQQLLKLRVIEVSIARQGKPSPATAAAYVAELDAFFPARSAAVNRELCQILIALEAPGTAKKTLDLMAHAATQEEQVAYLFALRQLRSGWKMDERRAYFGWFTQPRDAAGRNTTHVGEVARWFRDAGRDYADGTSYPGFLANIRRDAAATLTEPERASLSTVLATAMQTVNTLPKPGQRSFVRVWTMDDLLPALAGVKKHRDFANGRQAFVDAQCAYCHKVGDEGAGFGPDLTAIAARFTSRDVLESIIEPSKVVSEQFQNHTIVRNDGTETTGRIAEKTDAALVLVPNPLQPADRITVKKSDVKTRSASKLSPMPPGLVNSLSEADILDLIAYLESGGSAANGAFQK